MVKIHEDITKTIGNKPLVRVNRLTRGLRAAVVSKLESFNPCSSVKYRIGVSMIEAAEREHWICPDTVLLEPTSGNTGVALAFAAAAKGYRLALTVPETMSMERRQVLRALGAELVLTPGAKGMKGAIARAYEMAAADAAISCCSSSRIPRTLRSHRQTTAEEIWKDTDGRIDVLVCASAPAGP